LTAGNDRHLTRRSLTDPRLEMVYDSVDEGVSEISLVKKSRPNEKTTSLHERPAFFFAECRRPSDGPASSAKDQLSPFRIAFSGLEEKFEQASEDPACSG